MRHLSTTSTALAVRGQIAIQQAGERLASGLERRARVFREDAERGAQTAEYAMVGGVAAAVAGGAAAFCAANPELVGRVLEYVIEQVLGRIGSWF